MTVMGRRGAEYRGEEACRYILNWGKKDNNDCSNDVISALGVVFFRLHTLECSCDTTLLQTCIFVI